MQTTFTYIAVATRTKDLLQECCKCCEECQTCSKNHEQYPVGLDLTQLEKKTWNIFRFPECFRVLLSISLDNTHVCVYQHACPCRGCIQVKNNVTMVMLRGIKIGHYTVSVSYWKSTPVFSSVNYYILLYIISFLFVYFFHFCFYFCFKYITFLYGLYHLFKTQEKWFCPFSSTGGWWSTGYTTADPKCR